MNFNEWYEGRVDKFLIERRFAEVAFQWAQSRRIQIHAGQKLLVQHILDNDKGLSHSSRVILEKLIEE